MTQKSYSVSPKPSVRLKPGTNLPGLRPPASGDTHVARVSQPARIPSSTEEVCPALSDPFRAFWHLPAERTFSLNPGSQHSRQRPGLRRSHVALPREAHFTRISPAWYRAFLHRTAKRIFFFSQPSPNHFRGLSFGIALSFVRLSFSSCLCGLRGRPFRSLPPSAQTHVHNSPRRADSVHRVHRVHRVHHPSLLSWNARSSYARSTLNPQLSTHFPS